MNNSLCDTCQDKGKCGCNSDELISDGDLDQLEKYEIKVKVIVYQCGSYKGNINA